MNRSSCSILPAVVALCIGWGFSAISVRAEELSSDDGIKNETQRIVTATTSFLQSLDAEQRAKVVFPWTREKAATAASFKGGMNGQMSFVGEQYGKSMWSNYPVSDVPRPGLALGALGPEQRGAVLKILKTALSPEGYQKVRAVMGSDQALAESGTHFAAGTATYTIGIFGEPDATSPWMIQFGGHHLAINLTIAGGRGVLAPVLTGAQPAIYTSAGKTVRVLAKENDLAFNFLDSLDETQRTQAILNYRVSDLVSGPGRGGLEIQPEGIKGSTLNDAQRAKLLELISQWAGIVNEAYAAPRMAEIRAELPDTYFAWSGPLTHEAGKNGTSYCRIQEPKLMIEFSPQEVGGDPSMHVHTIYRDPTNDYGVAIK
jgi:hypothetical protein